MTTRILILLCLAFAFQQAYAVDLEKLPPMNETKHPADVELTGREIEAIEVALRQFRQDRFSKSGDLKHFSIQLTREPGKLFVAFLPDIEPNDRTTGGSTKYGTFIHYAVSLRTLKIIGYHFERD
jgi:hypothetical protein